MSQGSASGSTGERKEDCQQLQGGVGKWLIN